jgi:predicted DsbA family dithiol-disulfide isomerase
VRGGGGEEVGGEEADGEEVEITWRSFELDPAAPAEREEPLEEILARKYGMSLEKARQMKAHMTTVAAAEGLDFRFDAVKPGNTFEAHRLIHLAASEGRQGEMKERLLRAYCTEGTSIGDHAALAKAAADVETDAGEARAVLASDRFADDVRRDQARAREPGIQGVPSFFFNGEIGVSGAQPPEVFAQVFAELRGREREHGAGASAGPACDDQGCE